MPRWRRDGKELFYLGGNSRTLMAADVTYMPSLKIGVSKPVFETPFPQLSGWDVTADGKKFLLSMPAAVQNTPQPPLTVVLNWTALLKK
jgi:hypothetical protein